VWDATTGAVLVTLSGHADWVNSAAFSPDGARVVTASFDHTARVWDVKTGAVLATLSGHRDRVVGAVFSRDGSRIVTASADKTARIWDAMTGSASASLSGHTEQVVGATFSPDGARVITASVDRTARLWQLDPVILMSADERQAYICRERLIGARSFTDQEMQDPILRGREDLRHPCDRVGALSLAYYWRTAVGMVQMIGSPFANVPHPPGARRLD
jgi:predicted NACHT family NTPase